MIRAGIAALLLAAAAPVSAQTFAITGGTVALGDGSEPIPNGMVVIRDGRVVAAGDIRMTAGRGAGHRRHAANGSLRGSLPASPGSGLVEVDLSAEGSDDTTANGSPFSAAIDVVPSINPLASTIAVNRADGVTRALVAPGAGKSIFAGQGAVIDTGADMDPITSPRKFQFVELGEAGAGQGGRFALIGPCPVPQRLARGGGAAPLRGSDLGRAPESPSELDQPIVRDPNESRLMAPRRGAARTCS